METVPVQHLMYIAMLVTIATVTAENIQTAELLGKHLDYLMNKTLGVNKLQSRINVLEFERKKYNGGLLVNELSDIISNKISQHVEGLRKSKHILESEIALGSHKQSSRSKWTSCCRYDERKTVFDKSFKTKIDDSAICELVSDTTPLKYYQLPRAVLQQMRRNYIEMPFMKWQYVGSNQGVFFSYPAHRNPALCMGKHFDPRFRPWYVGAASPEKKRVVILLDSSRSMERTHNSERLLDIAVDAIQTLMDSLTPNDKIGIVAFNNTAFYPNDCFSQQVGYADAINKKKLKEGFLRSLQAGGQSKYTEAFEAAFKLLTNFNATRKVREARPSLRKHTHCVILFLSDGDASEIHHGKVNDIYRAIRKGNNKWLNSVTIFSYGLGKNVNLTLLGKIAKQDFDADIGKDEVKTMYGKKLKNITEGKVYRIEEPSQLRNELSFFYTSLINNQTDKEKPAFSVPYVDSGGLGLIFTAGFPVIGTRSNTKENFLAAVVAVDISIADLLGDVIKLKNDDRSYVFVIDGSGRVLIHPLMPVPDDTPSFIHIEALERDSSLKDVIKSMIEGKQGRKTILSARVAPAGDCNKIFVVNQTYHWQHIPNTNFSLCFVEEMGDYTVSLSPLLSIYGCRNKFGDPVLAHQCSNASVSKFRYHRLDLSSSPDICRHFYQISTIKSSVVKLSPQCFVDPVAYEHKSETAETVRSLENIFNDVLSAMSSKEVNSILGRRVLQKTLRDVIHSDVISDIIWTSCADDIWVKNSESDVIRRYVGTRTGMIRFYPGTNISALYDPIKRAWYELSLAHPKLRVFSPPYKDAAGAGNVITISHTIHTPQLPNTAENRGVTEEKVIGVMGLDLSLTSFYLELLRISPECEQRWHCFIMDYRGYFVLHKAYIEAEAPERKHITGDEGPLSQILLERGLMFRVRCLELETTKYKVSYAIVENAYLNEMNNSNKCKRYYMKAIPNSNAFFVAREYYSACFYYTCVKNDKLCHQHEDCIDHDNWSNRTCECPCRADLVINSCESFVDAKIDVLACYPFRQQHTAEKSNCLQESLPPCYNRKCDKLKSHTNCSKVVGCIWCQKRSTGGMLQNPYCSENDLCYDGFEGHRLPGFGIQQKTCATETGWDETLLLVICVSVGLFVITIALIICGCCILHRKMRRRKETLDSKRSKIKRENSETDDEIATIAAAIGATAQPLGSSCQSDSLSIGPPDQKQNSTSSQALSNRQRSFSSPQVVLSIVDSDGAEIARSLPRPVQIVRGNQPALKNSKLIFDKPNSRSKTSILLGSAGESSELSTTTSDGSTKLVPVCSTSRVRRSPTNANADNGKSTEGASCTISSNESANSQQTSEEALRDEIGNKSIATKFFSVLKIKSQTHKEKSSDENIDQQDATNNVNIQPGSDYMFCNMFAEPISNEGDIPIVQSDHSDMEFIEPLHPAEMVSDYISVSSRHGHNTIGGCFAKSQQKHDKMGNIGSENKANNDVNTWHDQNYFYNQEIGNISAELFSNITKRASMQKLEEDYKPSTVCKTGLDKNVNLDDTSHLKTTSTHLPNDSDSVSHSNSISRTEHRVDTKKRRREKKRKRSNRNTDRAKYLNTDNFVVYV